MSSGLAQDVTPAPDSAPVTEQVLPDSTATALEMGGSIEERIEGLAPEELAELLDAWIGITRRQSEELAQALAADEGTEAHEAAMGLRSELDTLLANADTLMEAASSAGVDLTRARQDLAVLRPDDSASLQVSTVPANRHKALELKVEVLEAQLRPLTREQVADQLEHWMEFLQRTCLEVRNVEVSALSTEDLEQVDAFNTRAVVLRGERAALIKRVDAVISALERKGGEISEARDFVDSVLARPPITGWNAAWSTARAWLTDKEGGIALAKSLAISVAILAAFWILSKVLGRLVQSAARRMSKASGLLREFVTSSVQRVTILVGVLIALSTLGINMTPLVAAIGAAGLVIGLALQGTLGNLASGLMIMVYQPFDVGDVVQVAGVSGKVFGMNLMTTAITTFDNQTIHVPNNKIWGDVITNVTANSTRRIDMVFGIGYADDISRAKEILARVVTGHEKVLADPEPNIRVHELGDSSVNLIVRPWTNTADYWDVYWDITEEVKRTFDAEGISIPFPQRDVHLIPAEAPGEEAEGVIVPQQREAPLQRSDAKG